MKRRRALRERNPLSNSRKARLHTAAEGGEANASPPTPYCHRGSGDAPSFLALPVVRATWLKKLPEGTERSDGPEDVGCRRHPTKARAAALAICCRRCLIACNLRQFDESSASVPEKSYAF